MHKIQTDRNSEFQAAQISEKAASRIQGPRDQRSPFLNQKAHNNSLSYPVQPNNPSIKYSTLRNAHRTPLHSQRHVNHATRPFLLLPDLDVNSTSTKFAALRHNIIHLAQQAPNHRSNSAKHLHHTSHFSHPPSHPRRQRTLQLRSWHPTSPSAKNFYPFTHTATTLGGGGKLRHRR